MHARVGLWGLSARPDAHVDGGGGGVAMSSELARIGTTTTLEFTDDQRAMIRDTYANGATDAEFAVLIEIARVRRLNPLLRQIHFVSRWDNEKHRSVWQPQVAIDGLRAIAERTGLYGGQDEPEFVENADGSPRVCKVRVYRTDWPRAAVGVAYWDEYVQTYRDKATGKQVTSPMWRKMPHGMLAKVAESLALRKAFPEDISGLYSAEEMAQASNDTDESDERPRAEVTRTPPPRLNPPPPPRDEEPENDPEASVGSRVWAAYVAAMPTLRTAAAVAERYIALPQDLRDEGESEPEKYLTDHGGPGALSMAREAVFRLGHRLAKDESALVVQNIALASMLDGQAKVFTLGEAVAWWRAERAAAKELGPKPAETLFYALGRRLAAELTPTATKAAVKSLKAAVEAADKGPGPGGNGGAPKPAAAQTTTANGGAAASSQGDGATELVTPEVIRWRDHIARKAWRGADQGAAAIAGSYWKNCTGEGELASLPKVQRSLLYTSTLDELTARGISEPHSFLDEIGVKNKVIERRAA